MSRLRTRIAAGAAIVGLGGLAGIALSAGQHQPSATVAEKPVVHTKVIRRTIHVTKHAKPRHPAAGPGGGTASGQSGSPGTSYGSATTGSSSSGSAPSSSTPVTTSTSGSASAPSSSTGSGTSPVVTHTSGASAGSGGGSSAPPVTTAASGAGGSAGGGEESEGGEESGGHDD